MRSIAEDSTIEIWINTIDPSTGAPVAPSSAFTTSDFAIHKNGSATEKTSTDGLTVTSPFDSETGLHLLQIDTSNDTGDAGFWVAGGRYQVRFNTTKTVGSVSIDGRLVPGGEFGLEHNTIRLSSGTGTGQVKLSSGYVAPNWGDVGNPTTTVGLTGTTISTSQAVDVTKIGGVGAAATNLAASAGVMYICLVDTVVNGHTPTTTEFQSDTITEATASHFNGRRIIFTSGVLTGQGTAITGYSLVGGIGQFTVVAMTEAPSNNDQFIIV